MKHSAKFLLKTLTLLIVLCNALFASHDVGVELRLECLNSCTTVVRFRGYRDCSGAIGMASNPMWIPLAPNCPNPPVSYSTTGISATEVTPVCPMVPTQCTSTGASFRGVHQYNWSAFYKTCQASPCAFDLAYKECCRPAGETSLIASGGQGMSIYHHGIDLSNPVCNNSPAYYNPPNFYMCNGQSNTYLMAGHDPDGDSLSYALATCLQDTGPMPVTYAAGYSWNAPLGPTWNCTIDSSTGLMQFIPQPVSPEVAVVCVTTYEYRNGVQIASNTRDMQVVVANCATANQPPNIGPITLVSGNGAVVGYDVYVCSQSPICLDISTIDPDSGQVFKYYWNHGIAGASFVDALNANVTDTLWSYFGNAVTGRFCWTPPSAGNYEFTLSARDNFCPIPAIRLIPVRIHVGAYPNSVATASLVACLDYHFEAIAGGCNPSLSHTYQWSGGDGLNSNTSIFDHHYTTAGDYPWEVVISDGQNMHDTIRDTAHVVQTLVWSTFSSGTTTLDACNGPTSCVLTANPGYQNYLWSTGDTTATIVVQSAGSYGVTVELPNGCRLHDQESVFMVPAKLSGFVTDHLGAPMPNQMVRLIRLQSVPLGLMVLDSALTDPAGYYQFCTITDTNLYVKVHPTQGVYPFDMPTYADSSLVWNQAHLVTPLLSGPTSLNVKTIYGQNPGGTAALGGIVLQGTNKVDSVGDPVGGLRLFLRNHSTGQIIGYRDTDLNGFFQFTSIPFGDYDVVPDFPYVDENLPPLVSVSAAQPSMLNLDFRLHSTWLELVVPVANAAYYLKEFSVNTFPNPFEDDCGLVLELPVNGVVQVTAFDLLGRQVNEPIQARLASGRYNWHVGNAWIKGIYFLRIEFNGATHIIRLVKD